MGMWHHHKSSGMMGIVGVIAAIIGLLVVAALIYEIMMNRSWISEHIPPEVKQSLPESVSKALE